MMERIKHVLLDTLNKLTKSIKTFNNIGAQLLDSIYHILGYKCQDFAIYTRRRHGYHILKCYHYRDQIYCSNFDENHFIDFHWVKCNEPTPLALDKC